MQILVRNIDRTITSEEITTKFEKFGKVSSFDLVLDAKTGLSKGFGFAEMPNTNEAEEAIAKMNGMKVGSTALRVKPAADTTISKHNKA